MEPLLDRQWILRMDNFYNSPDPCLLKKNHVNVAGIQHLYRKNVPLVVKKSN
jgi:hypothetical protein